MQAIATMDPVCLAMTLLLLIPGGDHTYVRLQYILSDEAWDFMPGDTDEKGQFLIPFL